MDLATAYDDVRYSGWSYRQAQPDRLATLGRLFGMDPADPARARVLELGCGEGANLLPVASAWPGARVVGIDLSAASIGRGSVTAARLGLGNLSLQVGDIARLPEGLGEFDYVIAHGVYSWVPEPVREALLQACRGALAPQGIAFVSYNVLPGGHLRRMLREMLLMHVEGIEESGPRCAAARELLAFLGEALANAGDRPDAAALAREAARLALRADASLFHDDLSPEFHLCHFRDFIERCEAHGLQFVAEAQYHEMSDAGLPAPARARLAALAGDLVAREQYLDFARVRRFRQSVLCRDQVELRDAGAEAVRGLSLSAQAQPAADGADVGTARSFRTPAGASFATSSPLFESALALLAREWPKAIPFEEVFMASAAGGAATDPEAGRAQLANLALRAHAAGALELHACQPRFERWPGVRPRASALARLQARQGEVVTNLLGATVNLDDPVARRLLDRLDGRRDRAHLLRDFPGSARQLEQDLEAFGTLALLLPEN